MLLLEYLVEDARDDSSEDDDEDDDNASEMVSEIGKSASKETTRDKDTQDSEASGLTPSNKKHNIRGSARSDKKKPTLSKQEKFKKCMEEFTKSQKESDEKFLEEMKHQTNIDAELRKQEIKAYTDAMTLLAKSISNRQQPTVQQPLTVQQHLMQ